MTNIMDGMDAARFNSANSRAKKPEDKTSKKESKEMPTVLKNLKNGS